MKYIKLFLVSFAILFLVVTCLGLLFPSTVVVSRAVDITASKDSIYLFIKDINGWKKWIDGVSESNLTIESPLVAKLGNTLVTISPSKATDSVINAEWQSRNGEKQESRLELYQQKGQFTAVVHWEFVQHIGWLPWERFSSMMNDKIMGTMMEKNLNNLKVAVENH